jgi:1-deoxy-D-xylulose-5-phosphate synthase
MMLTAIEHPGPAALRYPRGSGAGVDISRTPQQIEIGRGEVLREGADAAIIAYGTMVQPAMAAAERLAAEGIETAVANARFVKPLDREMILGLAAGCRLIVTVEEAYLAGGFGSAVLELLEAEGVTAQVIRMGVPDEIVPHGDPKQLLAGYGLDADGIYRRISEHIRAKGLRDDKKRLRAVK